MESFKNKKYRTLIFWNSNW